MSISAKLVYDGTNLYFPSELGCPRDDQLVGTDSEKLIEIAGRCCYSSFGTGRDSAGFHKHLIEVNHGSVHEHGWVHGLIRPRKNTDSYSFAKILLSCLNRRGVVVTPVKDDDSVFVSANFRCIREWDNYTILYGFDRDDSWPLRSWLECWASRLAPQLFPKPETFYDMMASSGLHGTLVLRPEHGLHSFVSLFLRGSRGFSHELVRHRKQMSQRSTRYCDESESEWIEHPLITEYKNNNNNEYRWSGQTLINEVIELSRSTYGLLVDDLQAWLVSRSVDKLTARKQARGAARGYLGNALSTELVFTDSVAGWQDILRQRGGVGADAEMRAETVLILGELQKSSYSEYFNNYGLEPSPDGIGLVVVKKG